MGISFSELVLYFMMYSFLGWICEETYCCVPSKKFVNRGFLAGPYLPIYGFGALLILLLLKPITQDTSSIGLLFIASVVVTSVLEYVTSWGMEKLFGIRWWDYSHKKFNINGRVCLQNSILFGILGVVLVHWIQPSAVRMISSMSDQSIRVVASLCMSVLLIDLTMTLNAVYNLEGKAKKLKVVLDALEGYNKKYHWHEPGNLSASIEKLEQICRANNDPQTMKFVDELKRLTTKDRGNRRIFQAFPKLKHIQLSNAFAILEKSAGEVEVKIDQAKEKLSKTVWGRIKEFYNPADKTAPTQLVKEESFAAGFHFYKIFWIFFIASILGFVIETLFCFFKDGYVQSRQGLLYGPFSQIYGFGAVLLTVLLRKIEKRSDMFVFVYSAFIGGVFEYVSSLLQEKIFGTVSWQYSKEALGIAGGRTSLLYMLFWGVLGTVFIKIIYPSLSRFIEKIPNRSGKMITWVLVVLLSVDIVLSCAALYRWRERDDGKAATNSIDVFLDKHYDDAVMQQTFSNMARVKSSSKN